MDMAMNFTLSRRSSSSNLSWADPSCLFIVCLVDHDGGEGGADDHGDQAHADDDDADDHDNGGSNNLRLISTPICLRWLLSRISCLFTNSWQIWP